MNKKNKKIILTQFQCVEELFKDLTSNQISKFITMNINFLVSEGLVGDLTDQELTKLINLTIDMFGCKDKEKSNVGTFYVNF